MTPPVFTPLEEAIDSARAVVDARTADVNGAKADHTLFIGQTALAREAVRINPTSESLETLRSAEATEQKASWICEQFSAALKAAESRLAEARKALAVELSTLEATEERERLNRDRETAVAAIRTAIESLCTAGRWAHTARIGEGQFCGLVVQALRANLQSTEVETLGAKLGVMLHFATASQRRG